MKKTNLFISMAMCLGLMLAGCGEADSSAPGSSATMSSDSSSSSLPISISSEQESSESSEVSSSSESSQEQPSSVESSASSEPEPEISYTPAEAIDAVAEIMSSLFGETISAVHDADGDYLVINFGSTATDTIKSYCDMYFVPEGFSYINDWTEDQFADGTQVEYTDWVCGSTALEYLVYEISGYEGEYEAYNGTYLQVQAFDMGA